MSTKRFVPELHDIGKIIIDIEKYKEIAKEKKLCIEGHTILPTDKEYFKNSPSWLGQFHHEISDATINKWVEKIKEYGDNIGDCINDENIHDLFVLLLADSAAATISRVVEKKNSNSVQKGVYKLWKGDCDISENKSLCDLIDEINNCNDGNKFLTDYKSILQMIPEDKDYKRRVTTLYTHLELVGKIYNIFKESTCIKKTDSELQVEYKNSDKCIAKHIDNAKKWPIMLALCRINFTHFFVRYHDIFLLKLRQELMANIKNNKYKNNILFTTSDSLLLFLSYRNNSESVYKDIFKPLLDNGFYIEVEETIRPISTKNSKQDCKNTYFIYPCDLGEEIEPPICEVCQLRRAEKEPYLKDSIKEWLCEKCKCIRKKGESLTIYNRWEEEGVRVVCWFKFSIYHKKLEKWIENAYKEYICEYYKEQVDDIMKDFRPLALKVDFNNDYNLMLEKFWKEIKQIEDNSISRAIENYDELGLFRYSPLLLKKVIQTYIQVFDEYFPRCASDYSCPINLSLFVGSIKYPIREYWRYLDSKEYKSFLNVKKQNVLEEQYTKDEVNKIMEIVESGNSLSSFMHNLVALYDNLKTNVYMELEIFNNRKKYSKLYEIISNMKGLTASKILALYRLVKEEEEKRITMGA
ncbi:MAG: hypothetical protein QW776_03150 [Candidatus Nitrosocaldus sp.]